MQLRKAEHIRLEELTASKKKNWPRKRAPKKGPKIKIFRQSGQDQHSASAWTFANLRHILAPSRSCQTRTQKCAGANCSQIMLCPLSARSCVRSMTSISDPEALCTQKAGYNSIFRSLLLSSILLICSAEHIRDLIDCSPIRITSHRAPCQTAQYSKR